MSDYKTIWTTLSAVDCSAYTKQKAGLTYLPWSDAWHLLMQHYPEAKYSYGDPEAYPNEDKSLTVEVHCTVTIGECERSMHLPVMDHRNRAIPNPDARAISDTRMRCLVKTLALFGLGLYIYRGEDLPAEPGPTAIIDNEQLQVLCKLADDAGIDVARINAAYDIESLSALPADQFQHCVNRLQASKRRGAK